jgi:hypothetical protein
MSDPGTMKRYLLGRASPEERVDLENAYLADPTSFEELTEAENDLIDSYVRGKLPEQDKKEFEQQYLASPGRQARVQFASALIDISQEPRPASVVQRSFPWPWFTLNQQIPKLRWGLALSAATVILAIGWLKVTHDREIRASLPSPQRGILHSPFAGTTPSNGQAPKGKDASGTEIARTETPELAEFTMKLTPGISRSIGAEAKTFTLPRVGSIDLQLTLDNDDYPAYGVVLETAEGKVIQRVGGLKSRVLSGNKVIDLRISSHLIRTGDYVVTLSGISAPTNSEEEVEVYSFRVAR